jgi:heptosyltransferase-1
MPETHASYLVIRLSSIGDIVHALPAVSALAETFPSARITWVVEDRYASLLKGNPLVRDFLTLDTLGWRDDLKSAATWRQILYSIRRLRECTFDAVIDFQGLVKSGALAGLCRSHVRVGFAAPWLKERGASLFYTHRVRADGRKHAIDENMALVESLGARPTEWKFPLPCSPDYEEYVDQMLARWGVNEFIIINPGGGWIAKRWPPSYYAELIRGLDPLFPGEFLLTGSPAEAKLISQIVRAAGSNRAHYFPATIDQFVALARRAKLFLGGDTGPLHLAAAVGVPIVALYGPTDPARNGPFSPFDIVLSTREPPNHTRRARHPRYLEEIPVAKALKAVRLRMARAG